MKPLGKKYSTDYIECFACGKSINLTNCNKHLNGKFCKQFQACNKNCEEELFQFKKKINKIKENIKNEKD